MPWAHNLLDAGRVTPHAKASAQLDVNEHTGQLAGYYINSPGKYFW